MILVSIAVFSILVVGIIIYICTNYTKDCSSGILFNSLFIVAGLCILAIMPILIIFFKNVIKVGYITTVYSTEERNKLISWYYDILTLLVCAAVIIISFSFIYENAYISAFAPAICIVTGIIWLLYSIMRNRNTVKIDTKSYIIDTLKLSKWVWIYIVVIAVLVALILTSILLSNTASHELIIILAISVIQLIEIVTLYSIYYEITPLVYFFKLLAIISYFIVFNYFKYGW